jgi:hypothetical protein
MSKKSRGSIDASDPIIINCAAAAITAKMDHNDATLKSLQRVD